MQNAKFEKLGYCPYETVLAKLQDLNDRSKCDVRRIGLWSLIGPKVVVRHSVSIHNAPKNDEIDKLFATDTLGYPIMQEIITQDVNASMVFIQLTQSDHYMPTPELTIRSCSNAKLIACNNSAFMAVVNTCVPYDKLDPKTTAGIKSTGKIDFGIGIPRNDRATPQIRTESGKIMDTMTKEVLYEGIGNIIEVWIYRI